MNEFTRLMRGHNDGDRAATAQLFDLVYDELKRLALRQYPRSSERTLSATGIVHEAFLKLQGSGRTGVTDRQHFFRLAKQVMRQVVTDHARARQADKRGGDWQRSTIDVEWAADPAPPDFMIRLDDALSDLARTEPRLVDVVELKFYVGLTETEIADVLGVSERSVQRDWNRARSVLRELIGDDGDEPNRRV